MRYEYGAMVNAPSKKGSAAGWSPFLWDVLTGDRSGTVSGARGDGRLRERKLRQGHN